MTWRPLLLSLISMSALAANAVAQAPRDRVQPVDVATGRIAGIIRSAGTNEPKPLRRARVTLNGAALDPGRTTITNDDGAFAFDRLPPGPYTLAAVKSGYVMTAYGASGAGRPGTIISLARGEQRTIRMAVPRGGVITGTLTDPDGQPMPGLQIRVFTSRIVAPAGQRRLVPVAGNAAVTDDRGVYRIYGLPAGEYAVVAQTRVGQQQRMGAGLRSVSAAEVNQALTLLKTSASRSRPGLPAPRALPPRVDAEPPRPFTVAPMFYPGTANPAGARLLTIGAGVERTSVDFQVEYVALATVSGAVIPASGRLTGAYVRLVSQQDITVDTSLRGVTADGNGLFAFEAVTPGRYTLAVRAGSTDAHDAALWDSTEVVVDGQDITGITLLPRQGLTLSGRLMFTGQRRAPQLGLRALGLPLVQALPLGGSPVAVVSGDRFELRGMQPGLYGPDPAKGFRAEVAGWWLKSITIGGREVLDSPLVLDRDSDDVVVTFADTASELSGRVLDDRGQPAAGRSVVVFAADESKWFFNSRRIAMVASDAKGQYVVRNLPAGEYLVMADPDFDQFEWFDPAILRNLMPTATRVTLRDNDRMTHDLKVLSR